MIGNVMTTPYQQITAHRFLWQTGTGAALVLSWILIPTITANLHGITGQARGGAILPEKQAAKEETQVLLVDAKAPHPRREAFRCQSPSFGGGANVHKILLQEKLKNTVFFHNGLSPLTAFQLSKKMVGFLFKY